MKETTRKPLEFIREGTKILTLASVLVDMGGYSFAVDDVLALMLSDKPNRCKD